MFQRNILPPSSRSKNKPAQLPCWLLSFFDPEEWRVCSAKSSVNLYQATKHHIPEDSVLLILACVKRTSVLVTDIKCPKYHLQDVVENSLLNINKQLLSMPCDANSVFFL
jgi:hypothetical protein